MNLRAGRGTDYPVVRQLRPKEKLIVRPPDGQWHAVVSTLTAADTVGWVHTSTVHVDALTSAEKSQLAVEARRLFARQLENDYLDQGMDIRVTTRGSDASTLRMEYVLFSRVWAHNFGKSGEHWVAIRDLGFKRVELHDGYDFGWSWTLD